MVGGYGASRANSEDVAASLVRRMATTSGRFGGNKSTDLDHDRGFQEFLHSLQTAALPPLLGRLRRAILALPLPGGV